MLQTELKIFAWRIDSAMYEGVLAVLAKSEDEARRLVRRYKPQYIALAEFTPEATIIDAHPTTPPRKKQAYFWHSTDKNDRSTLIVLAGSEDEARQMIRTKHDYFVPYMTPKPSAVIDPDTSTMFNPPIIVFSYMKDSFGELHQMSSF